MSAEDRLTTWRATQPPAPPRQRPQYRDLTTAELEELDRQGLDWATRTTRGRQMQQQPAPEGEGETR
jgi:hypothetical protein